MSFKEKTFYNFQTSDLPLDLNLAPIKRERLNKQKKLELRTALRKNLPVLNHAEIRRFRLPHHEALFAELIESGYENTAKFLKQMIDIQENLREKSGPGTEIWIGPQLVHSQENLELLAKCLSKAEKAHKLKNASVEWEELMRLAAFYAFGADDWWWLGEQLLKKCVSMKYHDGFKKQEAIAHFIIGKYLVENGKKPTSGRDFLEIARQMSEGKSWNCKKILEKCTDTLFIESCSLLYRTLIEEAWSIFRVDPKKASEICGIARKRAAEVCNYEGEFKALLLKSRCELLINNSSDAIATITKALNHSIRQKSITRVCEANIALALAYLQY